MIYSKERRREVLAECDGGRGTREVALLFNVSESWVRRVKQERREQGKAAPKLTRNRPPDWAAYADWLREKVRQKPDATLLELVALAAVEREWKTSDATICRALAALRLTRKKRRSGARSRRRCVKTQGVDRFAAGAGPRAGGVPRRDVGEDQHDAGLRPQRGGRAARGEDAVWAVEHHDVLRSHPSDGVRGPGVRRGGRSTDGSLWRGSSNTWRRSCVGETSW
jgi:transposase